jgi:hypothetical protein
MKENLKHKVNFNINIEILKEFNKIAKENAINKSQFIENYMKEWINKNK